MEILADSSNEMYEVEKIINCKIYRSKKYYLVKWLCYPIHESTWEAKTNLKDINNMIDTFESEYPYSIDQEMYKVFLEEQEKHLKREYKRKKKSKEFQSSSKFLQKKKKMEFFSHKELKDAYFDKLKIHLHLNMIKRKNKTPQSDLVIELGSSSSSNDESVTNEESNKENTIKIEEKKDFLQLIIPEMEYITNK